MDKVEKYFELYGKRILEDFERIRSTTKDSDVKGGKNEKVIANFLEQHISSYFITTGIELLDAHGFSSNEIDVCVCNRDQPFKNETGELVLVEGVDFVIQVKAILTNPEIERIAKNARSVKKLKRSHGKGDQIVVGDGIEYYVNRVPYFVIAFDTQLSFETTFNSIVSKLKEIPSEEQPDGIFVLNKASFLNFRDTKDSGFKSHTDQGWVPVSGWIGLETKEFTLLEFMKYSNTVVPKIKRMRNPILNYFSQDYLSNMNSIVESKS